MRPLYGPTQRALQDRHDSRRLADRLEALIVHPALSEAECAFIASRDFFFLATVNPEGQPSVSYKGGAPGLVRPRSETELVFPSYDGNGMFLSLGNLAATAQVGLLFIDFETPNRLRVQGEARVLDDEALRATFPGAQLLVQVTVREVWPNCPRYIHRMQRVSAAPHVPDAQGQAPLAGWKRIDMLQDDLPACDQGRAQQEGGLQSIDAWMDQVQRGDPAA